VAATDTHRSNYDRAVERLNETIAAAERTGNAPLRADALGAKARASWLRGDWREAHACSREATRVLEGLPESAELARALARHSQIEMLRGLPSAADTARRAIDVARRTGERAAEANARTNLFTAQAANSVMPEEADMRAIIELALDAGAPDEAVRALVNYLWSAATLGPLEPPSRVVDALLGKVGAGLAAQSYEQYLRFSTAALIYLPAGRWDEADAIVDAEPEPVDAATNRLVWFWVAAGLAFRRGDLERADRFLPRFCDEALASEESQRVVPMACVAVPRALLAGDMATIRGITDAVLALPNTSVSTGPSVSALARALAAAGERDRLERLLASVEGFAPAAGPGAASAVGRGLLALLDGRAGEAARLLGGAEDAVRGLGRHFEAACVALETARALEAAGDDAGAAAARERSARVLEPLGCVHPY
jgi:tetratricopeptide (TPR) repeat protein